MTIKDIAKLSGYGIGTVSRVLNNHSDVSDKARKKIMEVIEESNFQPNTNARHLKRQSVSSLSIIVKGNQNMLFADILEKMQMLFSRNGENAEVSYIDEARVIYNVEGWYEASTGSSTFSIGTNLHIYMLT